MSYYLDINRKSHVLKSFPIISIKIFFVLFSIYWIYRSFIIKGSTLFFIMGLFFLIWSLSSILLPIFVSLKKLYYLKDNILIVPDLLLFKNKIPLDDISSYEIKKASYFDKRFDTYRAEIITANNDYFELFGLKSKSQFEHIMKKLPTKKNFKMEQIKSDKKQKKEFTLNLLKKKPISSFLSKNVLKIIGVIVLLILIVFSIKVIYNKQLFLGLKDKFSQQSVKYGLDEDFKKFVEVKISEIKSDLAYYDHKGVILEGKVTQIVSTVNTPFVAGGKFGTENFVLDDGTGELGIMALELLEDIDPSLTIVEQVSKYGNQESIKLIINEGDKLRIIGTVGCGVQGDPTRVIINAINITKMN